MGDVTLKWIGLLGITATAFILGGILFIHFYDKIKLLFSDLLRFVGFVGQSVRRLSVASEYEVVINAVTRDFDDGRNKKLLPKCKVRWVDKESASNSYLKDGEAIVCLAFDREDHDKNFFLATYQYVQVGLIPDTRAFLHKAQATAVDLLTTKILLAKYRRGPLRELNATVVAADEQVRDRFARLHETHDRGLFERIVLPELHQSGAALSLRPPSHQIQQDLDRFIEWIHTIAMRAPGEEHDLAFNSEHLKIGVLLIADLETYFSRGANVYIDWGQRYAVRGYDAVYILARGQQRRTIALSVASTLEDRYGFERIAKSDSYTFVWENGEEVLVTCVSMRPNLAEAGHTLLQAAKKAQREETTLQGLVVSLYNDHVEVAVHGTSIIITPDRLSSKRILNCNRVVAMGDSLDLAVLEVGDSIDSVVLSNVGTSTDPSHRIEAVLSIGGPQRARVEYFVVGPSEVQVGMLVRLVDSGERVFVHRSKALHARLIPLSTVYPVRSLLDVVVTEFDEARTSFNGVIEQLSDPWTKAGSLRIGDIVKVAVRFLHKSGGFLVCELSNGIEALLFANELTEGPSAPRLQDLEIGSEVEVLVYEINHEYKQCRVSTRKAQSRNGKFYRQHVGRAFEAKVVDADANRLQFETSDGYKGVVDRSELFWCYCNSASAAFAPGDVLRLVAYEHDLWSDKVYFSRRRALKQVNAEFIGSVDYTTKFWGEVVERLDKVCVVQLDLNGNVAYGFVHLSQVSRLYWSDAIVERIMQPGARYEFKVRRVVPHDDIIEVTRIPVLEEYASNELAGTRVHATYSNSFRGVNYFYSNKVEGIINSSSNTGRLQLGDPIVVMRLSGLDEGYDLVD